jgi:hypothetical protein
MIGSKTGFILSDFNFATTQVGTLPVGQILVGRRKQFTYDCKNAGTKQEQDKKPGEVLYKLVKK